MEIVPLSVLLQTLSLAAAECGASAVSDVRFDFPISVDEPRVVQVFTDGDTITVSSTAASADSGAASDPRWIRHVSAQVCYEPSADTRRSPTAAAIGDASGYDPSALAELHNAWGIDGQAFPALARRTGRRPRVRTRARCAPSWTCPTDPWWPCWTPQ